MATSGDLHLATSGDFYMATDTSDRTGYGLAGCLVAG